MLVSQITLHKPYSDFTALEQLANNQPNWVLVFGSDAALRASANHIAQKFPQAHIVGCSTAGEISNQGVGDDSLVVTAIAFDTATVEETSTVLASMDDSLDAGVRLATALPKNGLRAVLIFGQGLAINGSAVIAGMSSVVGPQIPINGGLAGDGAAFAQTWVLDDQGLSTNRLACIGLYGESLRFSQGSYGGWSPFGPARKVTRCENNVLFELDGEPALSVYKRYLGEHAKGLPASGLLFPFAMLGSDHSESGLIRTILAVDEKEGSLTLAGDIDPQGYLKLMHASTDALVDGAEHAANAAMENHKDLTDGLALMVSCVGRKLVMGGRVDEEVEAVANVFGGAVTVAGFYSYGEIGPYGADCHARLHNQTMTVSLISETV
jgi:hypothetical protein